MEELDCLFGFARVMLRESELMKHVVFFRNVNLGRPNCPSKTQLEDAFISVGADTATSFQTNGTLVFSAPGRGSGANLVKSACLKLSAVCGLKEPAMVRSMKELCALVETAPFSGIELANVYECCASFLAPKRVELPVAPFESNRGDVEILSLNRSIALSLSRKFGASPGSPNAFLERTLKIPVTTRNWNTVIRLVGKHG